MGGCPSFGVQRQVYLRRVALGVVEIPHTLLCEGCGMSMSFSIWEAEMPKLHVDREPTNKHDIRGEPGPELVDLPPGADVVAAPEADAAPAETAETAETPTAAKKAAPRKAARAKAGDGS